MVVWRSAWPLPQLVRRAPLAQVPPLPPPLPVPRRPRTLPPLHAQAPPLHVCRNPLRQEPEPLQPQQIQQDCKMKSGAPLLQDFGLV